MDAGPNRDEYVKPGRAFRPWPAVTVHAEHIRLSGGLPVRLRANRLGIVLPNRRRTSRLQVLAFYCVVDAAPIDYCIVAINDSLLDDQIVGFENATAWPIDIPRVQKDQLAA